MSGKSSPYMKAKFLKLIVQRGPGQYAGIYRVLECGHKQRERSGGKARQATHAFCSTCEKEARMTGETPAAELDEQRTRARASKMESGRATMNPSMPWSDS